MEKWRLLGELYWAFFRIGGLTFGGGLTMLPMLQYELVEKKGWLAEDELLDCYAIGQCTPGIIAVNTATFVGYKKAGVAGGIFGTLGMISPSVIIITAIAMFLRSWMDNVWLGYALGGIRGVVCGLMMNTVLNLGRKSLVNRRAWVICAAAFLLALVVGLPTILIVVLAAMAGLLCDRFAQKGGADA